MREKGLRSLVHRVTQAQEDERERIARELHDDAVQALILLERELKSAAEIAEIPEPARSRLATMADLAESTGNSLRRFSRDLRPSILNDRGLVPAIEWLTEDMACRTQMEAHFNSEGQKRRLPRTVELALFRTAQEALRNVERHAHATSVEANLFFEPACVRLTVADNGSGFATPDAIEDLVPKGKLGLIGMKERASLLGGTVDIISAPQAGTRVFVDIPQ